MTIMMLSVAASVVAVYTVIGLYAWHAYNEKDVVVDEAEPKRKIKAKKL